MKDLLYTNREDYDSCKVCPHDKKMILYLLESRAKKVQQLR